MKNKIIYLFGLITLCLSAISCSNDDEKGGTVYPKTCTCITTTTFNGQVVSEVSSTTEIMSGSCSDGNSTSSANGATITISCQ